MKASSQDNVVSKKIRICFVCPKILPLFMHGIKSIFGGAEVDMYNIGTELAKDNAFEVSYVVADYNQKPELTIDNTKIIKSFNFKQNPIVSFIKIWKALKKVDADIYMIKTASPGVPLTRLFCKFNRKKFIYRTAHITDCDGTYIKNNPCLGFLYKKSLYSADIVLCQNKTDKKLLQDTIGITPTVIPNGSQHQENFNKMGDFILWVGRSVEFKNPEIFIELVKEFPNEKFVMICQKATGDTKYDDLINSASKIENLNFIERVEYQEVENYFRKAKVFVNTSDSEGFPNTFIQACKNKTPILSLNVNPDNLLDRYKCGICANGNYEILKNKLKLLLNEDIQNNMSENAYNYFLNNHDISNIIETYKEVFRGVM